MRILEGKFLAVIAGILLSILGIVANEKRERDNAKLAQEKHRQEIRKALRSAPPLKTDGLSTLGYQQ